MDWSTARDDTIRLARQARSLPELAAKQGTTPGAVKGAWRRWRAQWPEMPRLADLLGADVHDQAPGPDPALLAAGKPGLRLVPGAFAERSDHRSVPRVEPPRIVYPPGTRAPEPAPASNATDALPRSILCDGDNHYPCADPVVEAAKLAFARDVKPGAWINVGDAYDCWLISRFDKEPDRLFSGPARLQEEFDAARPYWREVCAISPRVHLILGNHENRLQKLLAANLGLFGLRSLDWPVMADLPSAVQVHPYGTRLRVGSITFEHGDRIGGRFGVLHPAHWLLTNRGNRNTVFGHTHRAETKFRTVYDETGEPHTYMAVNAGHSSDASKQNYQPEANWQTAFVYIECWTEAGKPRFTLHLIPVINGRFSWGGKVYDGRKWQ